ncbi:Ribosome-binding protein 1 [Penaeus vannamei]|uniref:Ribosome-binding protein 1 n=1 Tax=Penaeus vannamei TaxID=6689 RepID=A0A423UA06_PENVA|nr:Ribosome-binding protein 1 [Penaeus vannamei]
MVLSLGVNNVLLLSLAGRPPDPHASRPAPEHLDLSRPSTSPDLRSSSSPLAVGSSSSLRSDGMSRLPPLLSSIPLLLQSLLDVFIDESCIAVVVLAYVPTLQSRWRGVFVASFALSSTLSSSPQLLLSSLSLSLLILNHVRPPSLPPSSPALPHPSLSSGLLYSSLFSSLSLPLSSPPLLPLSLVSLDLTLNPSSVPICLILFSDLTLLTASSSRSQRPPLVSLSRPSSLHSARSISISLCVSPLSSLVFFFSLLSPRVSSRLALFRSSHETGASSLVKRSAAYPHGTMLRYFLMAMSSSDAPRSPPVLVNRPIRRLGSEFLGKRSSPPAVSLEESAEDTHACEDEACADEAEKMGSEFLGKRMGSEFLGKRMGSEFLGKRMGSEFLGKRAMGSEFLGKRAMGSEFLGKRVTGSEFLGKRAMGSEFLGKRGMGSEFLGKRAMGFRKFLGKRAMGSEFLGKRAMGSEFLGKRAMGSEFLGKRAMGSEFLGKRAMGSEFLGKRAMGSEFLGKRAMGSEFLGKRFVPGSLDSASVDTKRAVGSEFLG